MRGTLSSMGRHLSYRRNVMLGGPPFAHCIIRCKRVSACPTNCGRGTNVFYRGGP